MIDVAMTTQCSLCTKPKANLSCCLCKGALCKSCAEFLEEDRFSFLPQSPLACDGTVFCYNCYDLHVAPQISDYDDLLARAGEIRVYSKSQGKETRLIKRKALPVHVKDCADHQETILRLAFLAAHSGHNALVDLELTSRKHKEGSYQKTLWSGSAVPVNLDAKQLSREMPDPGNPN